jgi:hypothetical protein
MHQIGRLELALRGEVPALGDALAVHHDQIRGERIGLAFAWMRRCELGLDVPVVRGDERDPLALTLDHQTGGDRLHPASRQARHHHFLPQDRADLITVEAVEDAPGLLCVDQPKVQLTGVLRGGPDRVPGDLVEDHPVHRHLGLEDLPQMPGDRLALAVLVRREEELVGVLQQFLELGDLLFLVRVDDVQRFEIVIDVDAELGPLLALVLGRNLRGLPRKVTNMADTGLHDIVAAKVARDGLGLRG